jgi:hypothetical protein
VTDEEYLKMIFDKKPPMVCEDCGTTESADQRMYDKECRCGGSFVVNPQAYVRELTFDGPTTNLSQCLGVSEECAKKCEAFVENAVNNHWNLKRLIKEANETLALNDAEWTAFMYTIGWWDSARTRAGEI